MVVPTFNEAVNLPSLIAGIHEHVPHAHVLVVDDNSPDGTGALADSIAAQHFWHPSPMQSLGVVTLEKVSR